MRFAWSSPTEVALGIMSLDGWCPERNIVLLLVDGAELSSSACVDGEDGRRLLAGEAFRPDLAVYDAGATKTLPGYLVQEAVVEGLLRLTAVLSGELADHRLEDHLALSLTERIVQLGDEIAAQRAAGPVSADTRLELAELNGLTHMALLSFRRSRYSGKAWYVATEISSVIGARRTQAIAPLLPAVFEQMMRGREAWGSSRGLRQFWSRVCAATSASVSDAPSQGFAQLMEQWCVEIPPLMSPEEGARVVHRSMRRWGAGLPMLYGLTSDDLFAAVALVSRTEDRQALPQAEYGSDGAVPVLIGNAPMGR